MGAWGPAVLSNDISSDVRETYRDALGDGATGPAATDVVLEEHREDLVLSDSAADVWLGLALAQWQVGRLEDRVRDRALDLIDSGQDLRRWQALGAAAADLRNRQRHLDALRRKLTGPQRRPVRVRPFPKMTTPFAPGQLLHVRYGDSTAELHVLALSRRRDGVRPVVTVALAPGGPLLTDDFAAVRRDATGRYGPPEHVVTRLTTGDAAWGPGDPTPDRVPVLLEVSNQTYRDLFVEDSAFLATVRVRGVRGVPAHVEGVLRLVRWGQLEHYLLDSARRGSG